MEKQLKSKSVKNFLLIFIIPSLLFISNFLFFAFLKKQDLIHVITSEAQIYVVSFFAVILSIVFGCMILALIYLIKNKHF